MGIAEGLKMNVTLLDRLSKAKKYFGQHVKYGSVVADAITAFEMCNEKDTKMLLDSLPNVSQLLDELLTVLERKSVFKTLKKIARSEVVEAPVALKGWGSLCVHIAIQIEHGNKEYGMLLGYVYERLGEAIFAMR